MTDWHEKRGADAILRLGGVALLGLTWLLGVGETALVHHQPPNAVSPLELLTGMAMFATASLGAALSLLGRHLFDRVDISERWKNR